MKEKDFEQLEKLLEEFKETISKDDLQGLTEKKKEENKNNVKKAKERIKEYLDTETDAIVFLNKDRCVTVGTKIDLLSLMCSLIDSFKDKMELDEIVHAVVGGLALKSELEIDKDIVKKIMKELDKYL